MKIALDKFSLRPEPTEFYTANRIRAFQLVAEFQQLFTQQVSRRTAPQDAADRLIQRFLAADRGWNFRRLINEEVDESREMEVRQMVERTLAVAARGRQVVVMSVLSARGRTVAHYRHCRMVFQLIVEVMSELWGTRLNAGNWAAVARRIARKADFIARTLRLN
jgi:hypothetical protein